MKAILRITPRPISHDAENLLKEAFGEDIEIKTVNRSISDNDPMKVIYEEIEEQEKNSYKVVAIEPAVVMKDSYGIIINELNIPILSPVYDHEKGTGMPIVIGRDAEGRETFKISHYEIIEGIKTELITRPLK
ncbi:MAG: hypothetical protein ACOCQD_00730 [archaeon]